MPCAVPGTQWVLNNCSLSPAPNSPASSPSVGKGSCPGLQGEGAGGFPGTRGGDRPSVPRAPQLPPGWPHVRSAGKGRCPPPRAVPGGSGSVFLGSSPPPTCAGQGPTPRGPAPAPHPGLPPPHRLLPSSRQLWADWCPCPPRGDEGGCGLAWGGEREAGQRRPFLRVPAPRLFPRPRSAPSTLSGKSGSFYPEPMEGHCHRCCQQPSA